MSAASLFPTLTNWEPTRQTLHRYSNIAGVVARAHGKAHPKWWHISLKVQPDGLATDPMALPQGGAFELKLDLRRHEFLLTTSQGHRQSWSLAEGIPSTVLGENVLHAVAGLGLTADYAREKFKDDAPRPYNPAAAENFLTALGNANRILNQHRDSLPGQKGPVQLWPHGFDLAFEWFGTRLETHEHNGEVQTTPAQINFGFYPAEPAYFYANPWPFEKERLVQHALPHGARWHDEGWQGSMLPYADIADNPHAADRLPAYYGRVFVVASPTLMADSQ